MKPSLSDKEYIHPYQDHRQLLIYSLKGCSETEGIFALIPREYLTPPAVLVLNFLLYLHCRHIAGRSDH